ncbi:hypothetical protein FNF29_06475 [Cafeteria roenbergensis]|uniref:AB hydrolase-1 domain-containing protein n=2 Tax=Cafeteria roenbergensis TaxID=33653 RepID=A0A5A8C6M4_CAFRO|nr:hypothetical protein FNF29_06475 [Cafeteria roenbergensis]KAA0162486.1 hypothetical protein FNF31_03284 [Cafeteria roenbergensis]|eukprot:KAA0148692.1 hypothetical protein FNF29_06475 [Cafeteria roenbergensis]
MAAMPDYTLFAWLGVTAIALVLWTLPQLFIACCGSKTGAAQVKLEESPLAGATAPARHDGGSPASTEHVAAEPVTCEALTIAVICFLVLALVVFVAMFGLTGMVTFWNVKASECQAAPCTSASAADCCSYAVDPLRFPGPTAPVDVTYTTTDGAMHGWLMTNSTPASPGDGWLTVLYSHGSGANVAVNYRQQRYQWLLSLGRVRVFVYDYPGYGKSEGVPSYEGTGRAAAGAAAFLQAHINATSDANITYLGRSLGGNVAVAAIGASSSSSRRLAVQSTFASWGSNFGALFPFLGWAMVPGFQGAFEAGTQAQAFAARPGACAYESHSTADEWVPIAQGRALWELLKPTAAAQAPGCTSTFHEYNTALHDDPLTAGERAALGAWMQTARAS